MIEYLPHKILFELWDLKFPAYGFMLGIGYLLGFIWIYLRLKNKPKIKDHLLPLFICILLGFIIGGRLGYVLVNFAYYLKSPLSVFYIWDGGLAFYGGFILVLASVYSYVRVYKLDFVMILDQFLPALALALSIKRIGCFLNWCCYGIQSNLPWAVKVGNDVPRHPTQIYSSIFDFSLFLLLWYLVNKKNPRKGLVAGLFFLLYGAFRFLIDFIRAYDSVNYFGFLTYSQIISLIFILIGIVILLKKKFQFS